MTAAIRKLIATQPFVPCVIHTADGGILRVPTVDHIAVPPTGGRIFVFGDDGSYTVLSPGLVARFTIEGGAPVSMPKV